MHYIYHVIAQIMNILRNESMKIKMQILAGYIIAIKQWVATEIMLQTILVLGLTPSNMDCFLTTMPVMNPGFTKGGGHKIMDACCL